MPAVGIAAASAKDMRAGFGRRAVSGTHTYSAKAPCP